MKKRGYIFHFFLMFAACAVLACYMVIDRLSTDSVPPQIKIDEKEITLSIKDPKEKLLQGVSARDDEDGDVTDSLVIESVYGVTEDNRIVVSYAAFDKAGNVAKAERKVHYADYENPKLTLNAPLAFAYGRNFDVLSIVGATDVFEGDISNRVKATMLTGGKAISDEGIHGVHFRVTNSLGDTVQLVLPVEVYVSSGYDGKVELKDYLVYLPKGAGFQPNSYLKSFDYLDMSVDLTRGVPANITVRHSGDVDTSTPGVYAVKYNVECEFNQRKFTGFSKLIVVVEE